MQQLNKCAKMQLFLNKNYYTLPQLAKLCKISEDKILTLENGQCIPGHTYEVRQLTTFTCSGIDSALTEHTDLTTIYYYHKSLILWVKQAISKLKHLSLSETALEIKNSFKQELATALNGIATPGCQNFDQAWEYWIDGTWGKCLKNISIKCLAQKELSRLYITQFMEEHPSKITRGNKTKLINSINNYITASLDFDSYGMRHLVAEEPINKFKLNIKINKEYLA